MSNRALYDHYRSNIWNVDGLSADAVVGDDRLVDATQGSGVVEGYVSVYRPDKVGEFVIGLVYNDGHSVTVNDPQPDTEIAGILNTADDVYGRNQALVDRGGGVPSGIALDQGNTFLICDGLDRVVQPFTP